jgi:putative transposase
MLIKAETNVPETSAIFKSLLEKPEKIFELMRFDFKAIAERTLCELLKVELSHHLGRSEYERTGSKSNHRNGYYDKKYTPKNIGELNLRIPRDRNGTFSSELVSKYNSYEKAIEKDVSLMFLSGMSTRSIELISPEIFGRKISHGEVSQINNELLTGLENWRTRDLSNFKIKYMYIDGVNFHMRQGHSIDIIPMLVVIGVTTDNQKTFLTIQKGDKESATTWREVFKDLKGRGLDPSTVELGIMDGLSGLMAVFREEFVNAKIQRCQVHVARNVLCKVPKKSKQAVIDHLRDIFYAGTKSKALDNFEKFSLKYQQEIPSAVSCLSKVIEDCLTFYSFPQEHWISIRTTNLIERANKEFKRRTKSMEILAGENSAHRLLCFIALKMELKWKSSPLGRRYVLPNLPNFTQLN